MIAAPAAYLDACVHYGLVKALEARGFEVRSSVDERTTDLDDEAQLRYASDRGWVLRSHNERHFRPLHAAGIDHTGILIVPSAPPLERLVLRAAMMLTWISRQPEHESRFFKWGQLQELLERGFRLPEYDEDAVRAVLGH